ncbi:hypothetical protein E2C01_023263 [Portunus trituberculatus]|uniref:Uncharacterized protein n=1 Tax=Portunus trituberculatus TaxID=210409 RepID=A0A5B7E8C4_PORTR|nr:hypothetical protein [Portunus trituberculatus]
MLEEYIRPEAASWRYAVATSPRLRPRASLSRHRFLSRSGSACYAYQGRGGGGGSVLRGGHVAQEVRLKAAGTEAAAATLAPRGQCGAENSVCVIARGCDVHGYWWCQEPASGAAGPHNNHNHRPSTTRRQWPARTPSHTSPY